MNKITQIKELENKSWVIIIEDLKLYNYFFDHIQKLYNLYIAIDEIVKNMTFCTFDKN